VTGSASQSQSQVSIDASGVNEAAIARVVGMTQEWLETEPSKVLEVVERQARQLLSQQEALIGCREELEQWKKRAERQEEPKRSAAPFAIEPKKRKTHPKRPGRKVGHPGAWRKAPPALESDEHIEVRLEACPQCERSLGETQGRALEQTIVEVPVVVPRVIRLRTYRYDCPHCQHTVSSHHPLQVSQATGAAGTHLGPRALGFATALNKDFKLPLRKSCEILEQSFGLSLSPGGLSQAMARVARRLESEYDKILEQVRQSDVVYSDETGWWVNGPGYTLWVFTNQDTTYYRIVNQRTREMGRSILGADFAGVLVSDCLSIYDDLNPVQHKCYAHHLKAISNALETPEGKGSAYLLEVRTLLHSAQLIKHWMQTLPEEELQQARQQLEARFEYLLCQPRGHPHDPQSQQEEKVRRRLAKQHDHLFTFLDYESVDATNNQAERQLRPAVISRKISHGNKTEQGANTWAILASLAATAAQRGESFIDQVAQAMVLKPESLDSR
jgi:transposase